MPVAERPDVLTLDNFIGGRWVKARATDFFDVHNPAVGDVIGRTPLSTAGDVDAAVQAAAHAFPGWRDTPVNARVQVLYKFKQLCEQHFEELARTVTTEHGKTLDEARGSVRRGIECVEVACGAPSLMMGYGLEQIASGVDSNVFRQPLGVVADRLDDLAASVDEVDDPGRQVALFEKLEHAALGQGNLLGGLDDDRVAGNYGERQEPERHHGREVERGDGRGDADRLADDLAVDVRRDVFQAVSHEHRRSAAGDLDALDAAPHAAARLIQRLAVLGRDDAGELLEVVLEELLELEHGAGAHDGRRVAPGGEGLLRGCDGGVEIPGRRQGRFRDDRAERRVVDVHELARLRRYPLAADVVLEDFGSDHIAAIIASAGRGFRQLHNSPTSQLPNVTTPK